MTMEERIEKAAKARAKAGGYDWRSSGPIYKGAVRREVEASLRAAFPELFSDPPRSWLAPWEATERMCELGWGDVAKDWRSMRDSHLSTLKGEK